MIKIKIIIIEKFILLELYCEINKKKLFECNLYLFKYIVYSVLGKNGDFENCLKFF